MAEQTRLAWHATLWQQLESNILQQRLAHAYLLHGPAGIGKTDFAEQLSKTLLCETASSSPCGHCKSCHLFEANTHPDYRHLKSEDEKAIGIDSVRAISDFFTLTRQYGRAKIAIISDAERMTTAAANALLKTLEEPPPGTLLLLLSKQPSLLAITVRSRCQAIRFTVPAPAKALAWLEARGLTPEVARHALNMARGAPLAAFALASQEGFETLQDQIVEGARNLYAGRKDPIELAENYLKLGVKQALYTLWQWQCEMVRNLALKRDSADTQLARQIGQRRLLLQIEGLGLAIKRLDSQLNEQLLLEDMLISWIQ